MLLKLSLRSIIVLEEPLKGILFGKTITFFFLGQFYIFLNGLYVFD